MSTKKNQYSFRSQENAAYYFKNLNRLFENYTATFVETYLDAVNELKFEVDRYHAARLLDCVDIDRLDRGVSVKARRVEKIASVCDNYKIKKRAVGSGETLTALAVMIVQGNSNPLVGDARRLAAFMGY